MSEIVIVESEAGDWIGIYKDGRLLDEGHSIEPHDLLDILNVRHTYRRIDFEARNWGRLPQHEMELG